MNILLIAGGWSVEREVSLNGAKNIHESLEKLGHTVERLDPLDSLDALPKRASNSDFAFINLHGYPGEDGLIQAMLDRTGCPYQGSGPAASMLALHKSVAKCFFRSAGLNTPDWILLTEKPSADWQPPFPFPLFIKSNIGGSSLNMERVGGKEELGPALDRLFAVEHEYIVEPAAEGMELTCGVMGVLDESGKEQVVALPPILIKPLSGEGLFDYTSKYTPGAAEELCPAPISEELTRRVQEMSLAAHNALGCSGYSRADFVGMEGREPVLLEVNTLPGMTSNSLIPREAKAIGMSFEDFLQRLIDLGIARMQRLKDGQNA